MEGGRREELKSSLPLGDDLVEIAAYSHCQLVDYWAPGQKILRLHKISNVSRTLIAVKLSSGTIHPINGRIPLIRNRGPRIKWVNCPICTSLSREKWGQYSCNWLERGQASVNSRRADDPAKCFLSFEPAERAPASLPLYVASKVSDVSSNIPSKYAQLFHVASI